MVAAILGPVYAADARRPRSIAVEALAGALGCGVVGSVTDERVAVVTAAAILTNSERT